MPEDIEREIDYWIQYHGHRLGTEPAGTRERYRRDIEMQRAEKAARARQEPPVPTYPFKTF